MMNDKITEKANLLLEALAYADSHKTTQQNASKLQTAIDLTNSIKSGDLTAKHDLKGLFNAQAEGSGSDTDVSLMDVEVHGESRILQNVIDDLIEEVETAQEESTN
jgi:hypothetical protein